MRRCVIFTVFAVLAGVSAGAADFGLLLSPSVNYTSDSGGAGFGLSGTLTPWFSASIGENMNLYLSGKLTLRAYEYGKETWTRPPLVELDRMELNFRPTRTVFLTLGRQQFRDNAGMIASGLFDGLTGNFGLGKLRLSGGVYYTGFLYRGTAEILMTQRDRIDRAKSLDYGDFLATYPASRRMLVAAVGDFPDLSSRTSLTLNALGQFDLNDYRDSGESPLHSQYLEARYGLEPLDNLRLTLTCIGAAAESRGMETEFCLAAALGADWEIPGKLTDMLSAEFRWGSGAVNRAIGPFRPVSGIAQGSVFTPTLSGTMNARASYAVRPHRTLSFNAAGVFFWRTDVTTFRDAELDGASTDRLLGAEVYGQLVWAPQSALRLSAGGGFFFPGRAFVEGAPGRWNVNAALTVSL